MSMAVQNKGQININVDNISIHGKELEDARKERREMSETIEELKRGMADQKLERSKRIVVIAGEW